MTNTDRFLWGTATSSFQIEGQIENDMTEWEKLGKFRRDGNDPVYGSAIGHWDRWKEDFELLREIGVNAYRFSVEWSRIEKQPGIFDEQVLEKYKAFISWLNASDITPMLTLHHFTHPIWFHKQCPWHHDDSIEIFARFVEKVISVTEDDVPYLITFNEPVVWALAAYGDARFPPGEKNLNLMMTALYNILKAHAKVYKMIKTKYPAVNIGIAKHLICFQPEKWWSLIDHGLSAICDGFFNRILYKAFKQNRLRYYLPFLINFDKFLDLENTIDFWGVNYYFRMFTGLKADFKQPLNMKFINRSGEGLSDLGWENYSEGLDKLLQLTVKENKPVIITENGIAASDDQRRIEYLKNHLNIVEKARKNMPLKGYFYWSLLDNYEWLVGYNARFGLVETNAENPGYRKIKESAKYFNTFISNHK
ncbi:MAG: family 1 glycosylhydrolase [Calditrichaceae bacterium]|nr:family 1 glycosylhydrolase [Calditrichaceae bacterium]MBN2709590.1 family 1 glycosylhydrolase [Calditrichaceae bacterium]RQV92389.1 MAG: glycosyl hydrolase family protein [Calditrichota bacterium]